MDFGCPTIPQTTMFPDRPRFDQFLPCNFVLVISFFSSWSAFFISNLDLHLYIYSHAVYTPRTSAVNWVE